MAMGQCRVQSTRPADRRTESHKLFVDTVKFIGKPLSTARQWDARRGTDR